MTRAGPIGFTPGTFAGVTGTQVFTLHALFPFLVWWWPSWLLCGESPTDDDADAGKGELREGEGADGILGVPMVRPTLCMSQTWTLCPVSVQPTCAGLALVLRHRAEHEVRVIEL